MIRNYLNQYNNQKEIEKFIENEDFNLAVGDLLELFLFIGFLNSLFDVMDGIIEHYSEREDLPAIISAQYYANINNPDFPNRNPIISELKEIAIEIYESSPGYKYSNKEDLEGFKKLYKSIREEIHQLFKIAEKVVVNGLGGLNMQELGKLIIATIIVSFQLIATGKGNIINARLDFSKELVDVSIKKEGIKIITNNLN